MNIQTDPSLLKGVIDPLPASADQPIRSTFVHEANMRKLGEELAQSRPAVHGLGPFEFQRRIRENGDKILDVYRATNEAQGGERRQFNSAPGHHTSGFTSIANS